MTNPIQLVARVLLLAVVGLLVTGGAAFAHEIRSHVHPNQWSQPIQVDHQVIDLVAADDRASTELWLEPRLGAEDHSGSPCSPNEPAGHTSGTCCTVGCHVTLGVPIIEPVRTGGLIAAAAAELIEMLVGRSGDRTERPPRLG